MKKHLRISLLSLLIGTLAGPIIATLVIGISSEGFDGLMILFLPAVLPVAYFVGGPIAFAGTLVLVWIGHRNLRSQKSPFKLHYWLIQFAIVGSILGASFAVLPGLAISMYEGDHDRLFSGYGFVVSVGIATGALLSSLLAIVWHSYSTQNV